MTMQADGTARPATESSRDVPSGPSLAATAEAASPVTAVVSPCPPLQVWRVAPDGSLATGERGRLPDGAPAADLYPVDPAWPTCLRAGLAGRRGELLVEVHDGRLARVRVEPVVDAGGTLVELVVVEVPVTVEVSLTGADLRAHVERRLRDLLGAERARLAEELNAGAVPELFAVGLELQGAAARTTDPATADRLTRAVASIDGAIRHVRNAVFASCRVPPRRPSRVTDALLAVVDDARRILPNVELAPLPPRLDEPGWDAAADDVVATLRECLSNVARHADATWVGVAICCDDHSLSVRVDDDGCGPEAGSARRAAVSGGNGIENLRARARRWGGHFELRALVPRGTSACWSISR